MQIHQYAIINKFGTVILVDAIVMKILPVINCTKGYTWNPSTCECQCDMWCKPGQYLDHKNCVCKNKLVGRVIEEWTSIINETMINNKDNNTAEFNAINYVFIGLFLLTLVICFCVFAYFKWFKGNYTNNKIYTYKL